MKEKNIKEKIKAYFFLNPTVKLRVRQIERELRVPLPSVIRYTKELEQERLLKRAQIANVILYSADRTAKQFLVEKRCFNFKHLFSSGLIDFLIDKLSNPTVIVFGSYGRGEDIETSDIDFYIETPQKVKINIKKFEKILQRKIQLFIYNNIKSVENKELANNIVNGITLNGFVEVF